MDKVLEFIKDRAKERSTWLGFTGLLSAFGIALAPEQIELITVIGVSIAGLIATFTKDK